MNALRGIVSFSLMGVLFSAQAEMRVWTDKAGNTIEAEYVNTFSGKIMLLTPEGKQLKVPASGLSAADREYLATAIPPTIKIEVKVDKDRDTLASDSIGSYDYERKAETIKCIVSLRKTNVEKSTSELTAKIYVIGEEVAKSTRKVLNYKEMKFSFERGDPGEFKSDPVTVEYTKSNWAINRGYKYEGYLVVVEDEKGTVIESEASQSLYESNLDKIRRYGDNAVFDKDFDKMAS